MPTPAGRRSVRSHALAAVRRAPAKLAHLRPGELVLLLEAPLLLPLAALALRRWGLRRVQLRLSRRPIRHRWRPVDDGEAHEAARRIAWVVQVTAAYGPWPANCLQRSIVLWWFLRRRGLEGDLRIGVRRDPERGGLDFHAWIEHDGAVINDRRDVRERYATFDRAIVPPGADFS